MQIPLLSFLFKKKKNKLKIPDSILIKNLREICKNSAISIYENSTIYHHTQSYFIPLLLLNPTKGIYLFEYKEWSYEDLKNSTISKATNQDSTDKNLAYEKTHDFIKQKFNELTHCDGIKIHNYLIMENLNTDEYKQLDESFKELLPYQKIIFSNSSETEILEKLNNAPVCSSPLGDESNIMANLFVQYLIFSNDKKIDLATDEQIKFIDSTVSGVEALCGGSNSGKTSSILLKALLEKLRNPKLRVVIIEPTLLACEILKKKLLNIIEYAIVEVDITSIEVITPLTLLNKHLVKIRKTPLDEIVYIDEVLMKKNFNIADLIICDDSNLLSNEFIDYLKHIQKTKSLVLVNDKNMQDVKYRFNKSFKTKKVELVFKQANRYAKTLRIISNLLKEDATKKILVISNNDSKRKLSEDLECFIESEVTLLNSSQNLSLQELDNLILSSYEQISAMNADIVIALDIEETTLSKLKYAIDIAEEKSFIIYDETGENIQKLKEENV
ncbi:MAG: hypothetical protein U9N33_11000 [Campylobacterota bacterium]|nr:hypothetical protein [Campylobacterota bacterium]